MLRVVFAAVLIAAAASRADAAPHLVLTKSVALVERVNGAERLVPSARAVVPPGGRLRITIVAANDGDRPAQSVVVREAIERDQQFVSASAAPAEHVEYSVDDGKTWSAAPLVRAQTPNGTVERKAAAAEYTALRWVEQPPIPAKGSATYRYDVLVK